MKVSGKIFFFQWYFLHKLILSISLINKIFYRKNLIALKKKIHNFKLQLFLKWITFFSLAINLFHYFTEKVLK